MTKAFFDLEGIRIDSEDVVARASIDQEGLLRAWLHLVQSRSELSSDAVAMLSSVKRDLADRLDYWAFIAAAHVWFESLSVRTGEMSADSAFAEFEDEVEIWNALKIDIAGHYDLAELSLHNFLQEVDLRAKEKPAPPDAVRCLTIAASKGMEFEHVFLIGLVEEELPGYYACKKGDASDEIREERRNCFVAITRAEETLTLTYSDRYFGYNKSPSRFLKEMGLL
jgi:DNA helicase-2/ATP-dependent DNA helicase PcrA